MASLESRSAERDEDGDLVKAARQGDRAAFETLYTRHRNRVYALVWRLCGGDHGLAEDVLQETFLIAYRRLPTWRGEAPLERWMVRIAVREALRARSRLRRWSLQWRPVPAPAGEPAA